MPSIYTTPGVYIEEQGAFPNSAIAVATAIPVFIGYTEKANRNNKSLLYTPTKISTYAEYFELFGAGFCAKFSVIDPGIDNHLPEYSIDGKNKVVAIEDKNTFYFHSAIKLFFANAGGDCYILSIGLYKDVIVNGISLKDFEATTEKPATVWDLLNKESEPTLVVVPDFIALGVDAYPLYVDILKHCADTQSRFGIFDLAKQKSNQAVDDIVLPFRAAIGTEHLNYGAAYYPWLKTTIIEAEEVDEKNLGGFVEVLKILPQPDPSITDKAHEGNNISVLVKQAFETPGTLFNDGFTEESFHQSLLKISPTYATILNEIRTQLNKLPPSAAMAGIYASVDRNRGVWKAPANITLNQVTAATVNITETQQGSLNVDAISGKSVNVIKDFPAMGTTVWGARTLDGNNQDWRFINIRRTLIMIEQSLKLATRAYVFEPNEANTWVTVKSMMDNFLTNLWKEGALAGAKSEEAFNVQVGLGTTMTANDILDGKMIVSVRVALSHPAEFIAITLLQQMQQS